MSRFSSHEFSLHGVFALVSDNRAQTSSSLLVADIQQLETHLKNKKVREQEARDPLLNQLRQLISTFQSTTEQLASTVAASVHAEVQHQLHIIVGK